MDNVNNAARQYDMLNVRLEFVLAVTLMEKACLMHTCDIEFANAIHDCISVKDWDDFNVSRQFTKIKENALRVKSIVEYAYNRISSVIDLSKVQLPDEDSGRVWPFVNDEWIYKEEFISAIIDSILLMERTAGCFAVWLNVPYINLETIEKRMDAYRESFLRVADKKYGPLVVGLIEEGNGINEWWYKHTADETE